MRLDCTVIALTFRQKATNVTAQSKFFFCAHFTPTSLVLIEVNDHKMVRHTLMYNGQLLW